MLSFAEEICLLAIDDIARLDLVGRRLVDKLHEVRLALLGQRLF